MASFIKSSISLMSLSLGPSQFASSERDAFPPAEDTLVFVCGVPAMYDALCGPRGERELPPDSALATLGYTADMVFKF